MSGSSATGNRAHVLALRIPIRSWLYRELINNGCDGSWCKALQTVVDVDERWLAALLAADEQSPQRIPHFQVRLLNTAVGSEARDCLFIGPARSHQSPTHTEIRRKRVWLGHLFGDGWHFRPRIEHMCNPTVPECAEVVHT